MKKVFKYGVLVLFIGLMPVVASSADLLDQVGSAIMSKNMAFLKNNFDDNVELTIMNKEGTYSKAQASQILKSFLDKAGATGITTKHKGQSGGSEYAIFELTTSQGKFRVYVYVKQKGNKKVIQEMSFVQD